MAQEAQWKFRVETLGSALRNLKDEELELILDSWGQEGWDVISVSNLTSSNKVRLVGKRPLTPGARRQRDWPSY
jgi:hypothetical protein